jgi:SAM-dependent methyltransferase
MYVVIHEVERQRFQGFLSGAQLQAQFQDVTIFRVPEDWNPPEQSGGEGVVQRYFDQYFVFLPKTEPVREQQVIDALFATVAEAYDDLIEPGRNQENIRLLLQHVLTFVPSDQDGIRVVDIGSGTGLAHNVAQQVGVEVVGIDRSPEMRAIAARHGMVVYDARQFELISTLYDGAIASYLLHLVVDADLLHAVWLRLRPGRPLVANFHKGQGVREASQLFRAWGAEVRMNEPRAAGGEHGLYATFRKVE